MKNLKGEPPRKSWESKMYRANIGSLSESGWNSENSLNEPIRRSRTFFRGDEVPPGLFCRWNGFKLTKGVTNHRHDSSFVSCHDDQHPSLHAKLLEGRDDVDPAPLCYNRGHIKGFGGWKRWVFLFNDLPDGSAANYFGLDYCSTMPPTAGVITDINGLIDTVEAAWRHGIPGDAIVVLLGPKMAEVPWPAGLKTVSWWANARNLINSKGGLMAFRGDSNYYGQDQRETVPCQGCGETVKNSNFCSKCGKALLTTCKGCQADLDSGDKFCHECGKKVE